MFVRFVKKSHFLGKKVGITPGPIPGLILQDNENNTLTVLGVDGAGNQVDISSVATLTPAPTVDQPTLLTVGAPTAMTFAVTAVGPLGTVNLTITATWNDGSIGPFVITQPLTLVAGPAGGITIVPGTPSVNP